MQDNKKSFWSDVGGAALSGSTAGLPIGMFSLLSGDPRKEALKRALQASLVGAGIGGGGIAAGKALMGEVEPDEPGAYTRRGAVGGGTIGALAGAGLALLARKRLLAKPGHGLIESLANMGPGKGALIGALGGGAYGLSKAADEGMAMDYYTSELDRLQREKKKRELIEQVLAEQGI